MRKKVVSTVRCSQDKATGCDPMEHPDDVGQGVFHFPEGLRQDQKWQPKTGLRKGNHGQKGMKEKGRVFSKGRDRQWGRMLTGSRPGGRIRFK